MQKAVDQQVFRRLLIRNVSLPLLLGILTSGLFIWIIFFLIQTSRLTNHSTQVIGRAFRLEKLAVDAETGVRGYLITGEESYKEPYLRAKKILPENFSELKAFVADDPAQVAKLGVFQELFVRWTQYAENSIELRKKGRDNINVTAEDNGKAIMDEMRNVLTDFITAEEALHDQRNESTDQFIRIAVGVVIGFSFIVGAIIALFGRRQLWVLSEAYEDSIRKQTEQNQQLEEQQWVEFGRSELNSRMLGAKKVFEVSQVILKYLCEYLGAQVGLLYIANEQEIFESRASFATADLEQVSKLHFRSGESLVGEAAHLNKILKLQNIPGDYLKIKTGLGDKKPHHIVIVPFKSEENVNVVAELGFYAPLEAKAEQFLEVISQAVSLAVTSATYRERLERLYRDVQNQAEELQSQQEELRVSNEELEEQTKLLKETQTRLESQHAELEQTNSQLEEQTEELEKQKETLSQQNEDLNRARDVLEEKASELTRVSQYKSEFLANMSHELRTPLNSSMILAKLLADNKEQNLTPKQVEFAQQIISSGNDLLNLINDILDLAKVESGKLDVRPDKFKVQELLDSLKKTFNPIASERRLNFVVSKDSDVPETIFMDRQRCEQILKNLLSNAMKFTHQGRVELSVHRAENDKISFSVADTGIGIAKEQQTLIFEAFRQADGTDSRKYSGTGLGLSISRDLANMLGGDVRVASEPGKGSCFTLTLPVTYLSPGQGTAPAMEEAPKAQDPPAVESAKAPPVKKKNLVPTLFADDRDLISEKDHAVLIVEDDEKFAKILVDLAHENDFKAVVSGMADDAIDLIAAYSFNAVLLDVHLPDHSGLLVLDSLKQNPKTRHIPVHVISGFDFTQQALQMGALGFMLKPVKREELKETFKKIETKLQQDIKRVLIVEDDFAQREAIAKLIEDKQIQVISVGLAKEGLELLKTQSFDCLIMDLSLPDMSGFEFLDVLAKEEQASHPPVIVYTGRDLNRDEEERLRRHSQSLIIKGANSPDRLLNEVTLFLHNVESKLGPDRQKMLEALRSREKIFEKKIIMIVDDDIRNVFALTAALEQKGAQVVIARDGKEAVDKLNERPRVDLVLMDIMMPVMNGYEAMKEIRKQDRFKKLPMIALTAKAMKDDRDLCLSAGANDYLPKPVDTEKLLSLARIWMSNGDGKRNG